MLVPSMNHVLQYTGLLQGEITGSSLVAYSSSGVVRVCGLLSNYALEDTDIRASQPSIHKVR